MSEKLSQLPSSSSPAANDTIISHDTSANEDVQVQVSNIVNPALGTNPYKFSYYWAAGESGYIPASSNDIIKFDTLVFDTSSNYNTSTYEFTAPIAGFYQFNFCVGCNTYADDLINIYLYHNGGIVANSTSIYTTAALNLLYAGSALIQASANDTFAVYGRHSASGSMGVNGGSATTYWQGFLVSAS